MSPKEQNKQKKGSDHHRSWLEDGLVLALIGLLAAGLICLVYLFGARLFQSDTGQKKIVSESAPGKVPSDKRVAGQEKKSSFNEIVPVEPPDSDHITADSDGLIAAYPLDGHARDVGGGERHGIVHGAVPMTDRFGNTGGAMAFDGQDDYIEFGRPLVSGAFTISVWIKSNGIQNYMAVPVSQGNMRYSGFGINFSKGLYNGFTWGTEDPSKKYNTTWGYRTWHTLSFKFPKNIEKDNSWHHLAVTCQGKRVAVYRDGALQGETRHLPVLHGNFNFTIGRASVNKEYNHRAFNGVIDDVRVYARALSPAKIKDLYRENKWRG